MRSRKSFFEWKKIEDLIFDVDNNKFIETNHAIDSGIMISLSIGKEFGRFENIDKFVEKMYSMNADKILTEEELLRVFNYDDLYIHDEIIKIMQNQQDFIIGSIARDQYIAQCDFFQLESLLD